jgi:hypothetical protein
MPQPRDDVSARVVEPRSYMNVQEKEIVGFWPKEDTYFEAFDNGAVTMQPMARFMQDQNPLVPPNSFSFAHYKPTWPDEDMLNQPIQFWDHSQIPRTTVESSYDARRNKSVNSSVPPGNQFRNLPHIPEETVEVFEPYNDVSFQKNDNASSRPEDSMNLVDVGDDVMGIQSPVTQGLLHSSVQVSNKHQDQHTSEPTQVRQLGSFELPPAPKRDYMFRDLSEQTSLVSPLPSNLPSSNSMVTYHAINQRPRQITPQQRLATAHHMLRQSPGIIDVTDTKPYPRNVLNYRFMEDIPQDVKSWGQLKQWAQQNPDMMPGVSMDKLVLLQALHFQDLVRNQLS